VDETSGAELGVDMLGGMMLGTIDETQVALDHGFTISAVISGATTSAAISVGTVSAAISTGTISTEMTVNG
jgi:hypothetical protein